MTPFFADTGVNPRTEFEHIDPSTNNITPNDRKESLNANKFCRGNAKNN